MIDLMPCPFCGGKAKLSREEFQVGIGEVDTHHFVECLECGCRTKGAGMLDADSVLERVADVVTAWERRVEDGK